MKTQTNLMSDEVAIPELGKFINSHQISQELREDDVKENYPALLRALKEGNLVLSGEKPVLKLSEPIKNESGEDVLTQVEFKTRIKPNEMANLSKGLNLSKDSFQYALKCTAFIIGQPKAYLDRFSKFDYTVIQQLAAVFI